MTAPTVTCECGCGQPVPLAKRNQASKGLVVGEPLRFVHGHNASRPVTPELFTQCQRGGPDGTCWVWPSAKPNGYGYLSVGGRKEYAHRVSYECLIGPIPDGLELDHLCRNPPCVNPEHLEPVTHLENMRRGLKVALKLTCAQGHKWVPENIYTDRRGRRQCRVCGLERSRAWHEQHRRSA